MYTIRLSHSAVKALRKAPPDVSARIRSKLKELAADPFAAPNVKKLTAHPGYRLRVGDWRVVYLQENDVLVIQVIEIGQSKEVYR